jgi:hypothetical protein
VIDLDLLDDQLEQALTAELRTLRSGARTTTAAPPPPAVVVAPARPSPARPAARPAVRASVRAEAAPPPVDDAQLGLGEHARLAARLLADGSLADADRHIAAHAELAQQRGSRSDRCDVAAWATMRALLDGRQEDARRGTDLVRALGQQAGDPGAEKRYWEQRFWVVLAWGDEDEQYELLDRCREWAYRYGDVGWRGRLALLVARMGRMDEAGRELDAGMSGLDGGGEGATLDVVTNLAETAALLGDGRRASALERPLAAHPDAVVVHGPAWICKGSIARHQAHLAAAMGNWSRADERFGAAVDTNRRLGAQPLLARTLHEWGSTLTRRDDARARQLLDESLQLAGRLHLAGLTEPSQALAS